MGYRINSVRATQFRQWCTHVLRQFAIRGYAVDKKRMDIILEAGGDRLLPDAGKITAEFAKTFAESEFEKYRLLQDRQFVSDFDRFCEELLPYSQPETE